MTISKSLTTGPKQEPTSSTTSSTSRHPHKEVASPPTEDAAPAAPNTTTTADRSAAASRNNTTKAYSSSCPPLATALGDQAHTKARDKGKKRGLFIFGRKNTEEKRQQHQDEPQAKATVSARVATSAPLDTVSSSFIKPTSGMPSAKPATTSPALLEQPSRSPPSPGRALSASSPRVVSPAGSQIFERDVQESLLPNSPAIPSHFSTENHIPPVLDASSEAITDDRLNPDSVEIITHSSHLPAASVLSGMPSMDNLSSAWEQDLQSFSEKDDAASTYGSFDTTDVHRLSFISFADVVQAEQTSHTSPPPDCRDSIQLAGLTSLASMNMNRSSSPLRSPVSSQGLGTSPPTSKSGSIKGFELGPSRKPLGSPTSIHYNLPAIGGEVSIETMTQALRRTGSADLGGIRSIPTSPIGGPSR